MRTVVFGAGKSGVAAANLLAARGERVVITDSQQASAIALADSIDPRVECVFGEHPPALLDETSEIVLSPGIPRTIPILTEAVQRGIPIIAEIELASRYMRGRIAAITGSNGKSTTTALIGAILGEASLAPVVAGNIGEPLSGSISDLERNYVIELSSFQLETVSLFRANVALLLNITPDHMDRYATLDDYAAAKHRVFRNQRASDCAVVNADDARTANPQTEAEVWRFSSTRRVVPGAWLDGSELVLDIGAGESRIARSRLRLEGLANVENALAAWLAARRLGAGDDAVARAFASFAGLPHRMVLVRELGGVRWINDSKGTNVDATLKSLEGMPDASVFLILGGKDKAGEFERLGPLVRAKVKAVLTIGHAAPKVEEKLRGTAPIVACGDMRGAIDYGRANAATGDVVLLSPACASFDQFRNFEHRGEVFEEMVRALGERA
ncbi:MAG: UDP-N-acetylmuramoyl-L-alanine--D-glutamate ligase [Acidobacteria bacterium]|nr:UDP-N-acetylmuramoyl-L-alanine--D-glutamate ligase [Acidobacteriota bacterium]